MNDRTKRRNSIASLQSCSSARIIKDDAGLLKDQVDQPKLGDDVSDASNRKRQQVRKRSLFKYEVEADDEKNFLAAVRADPRAIDKQVRDLMKNSASPQKNS